MDEELTKSAQQSLIFFEEFVRRKEVAEFIKWYREYLNIPAEGLKFTEADKKELDEVLGDMSIPKRASAQFPEPERGKPFRVINTCLAFTGQQGVKSFNIAFTLLHYLFFNRVTDKAFLKDMASDDLLKLEHLPSELSWYDDEDHFLLKHMHGHFYGISKTHPVVLYINPEASQRHIQDFISKNWDLIKAHRNDEENKITGLRKKSRSKQKRNDFIYENRKLTRSEIMKLVSAKFGEILDMGHIGKIISIEKKRRENK